VGRVLAEHLDLAGVGVTEALEDLDRGRLTGPVGSEEGKDLAAADLEVDPPSRLRPSRRISAARGR
jgi:hypothetical protein